MNGILLGMALKGTVVLGTAWMLTIALRRRSAAARHPVWTAAAAAVIALPFLSSGLPSLRVPAGVADLSAASSLVFRAIAIAGAEGTPVSTSPGAPAAAPAATKSAMPVMRLGQVIPVLWAAGTVAMIL